MTISIATVPAPRNRLWCCLGGHYHATSNGFFEAIFVDSQPIAMVDQRRHMRVSVSMSFRTQSFIA